MSEERKPVKVQYFPTEFDVWNVEFAKVVPHCLGRGIDVGCGIRSPQRNVLRVDIDPDVEPDLVCDAADLESVLIVLGEREFDFYWSSHNIEHNEDPQAVLREAGWIVKEGGKVVLIIPDKTWTVGRDPTHKHEWTHNEFLEEYAIPECGNLQLIQTGVAAPEWSFYVVYTRLPEGQEVDEKRVETVIKDAHKLVGPRDWREHPLSVFCWSDHPRLTTGFGTVHRQILRGFQAALFRLSVLGVFETDVGSPGEFPYKVQPVCRHDTHGHEAAPALIRKERLDVIFSLADPGGQFTRVKLCQMQMIGQPWVLYMPIEGVPIADGYLNLIRDVHSKGGRVVLYAQCAADAVRDASNGELELEHLYHGADHGPFRPYPQPLRDKMRKALGWEGRFVVMNVSRNKRSNRHPVYIEAARLLADMGYSEVLFYLHCHPFEEYLLNGWDLRMIARMNGIGGWMPGEKPEGAENMIVFPPDMKDQLHGTPRHFGRSSINWETQKPPIDAQERQFLFSHLGFIDRLNLADMYIDASSVQGFCLPNVEAMACGLPVFATDDDFVRREVLEGAGRFLPASAVDYRHTGARLMMVSPATIAQEVVWAMENPTELETMRRASLERAKAFKWKPTRDRFVEIVKEVGGYEAQH